MKIVLLAVPVIPVGAFIAASSVDTGSNLVASGS
jgi:hypothetical protein